MKSILTFSKWTKINVQKWVAKNTLTDKKFCLDKKKLSSQIKRNILFFVMIFLRDFFQYLILLFQNILTNYLKLLVLLEKANKRFLFKNSH